MTARRKTNMARRTDWFVHDRFGMFIHWGLYALPARHEWVKHRERMTDEQYEKYLRHFNPDLYDPTEWARIARQAGMRYVVVTAKHHEGFCLWDSAYTDYKVTNTPYGRDVLGPLVEAFRAEGLRVGFYYSLLDWHHPEFPVDRYHPQRDDPGFRQQTSGRDVRKYAAYVRKQVRELLTRFGTIDILWLDFSYPGPDGKGKDDWQSEKLIRMVRKLQPHILLNDRADLPETADFRTPEQIVPQEGLRDENGQPVIWEGCHTFSGSWGYHRDEQTWKSLPMLLRLLVEHVSKGGNLLLNVGPTARGEFDSRARTRLEAIGGWMRYHSRAIYGCTAPPPEWTPPQDCRYTFNPKTRRLYLHIFAWPFKTIRLPNLAGRLDYAQMLHDASELEFRQERKATDSQTSNSVSLDLPVLKPDTAVPVVELFLK